jgi:hypothetical protein
MDKPTNETETAEETPLKNIEADYDEIDGDEAQLIDELLAEGYSLAEVRRMIGEIDPDEDDYGYGDDDLDRDLPPWGDDE